MDICDTLFKTKGIVTYESKVFKESHLFYCIAVDEDMCQVGGGWVENHFLFYQNLCRDGLLWTTVWGGWLSYDKQWWSDD